MNSSLLRSWGFSVLDLESRHLKSAVIAFWTVLGLTLEVVGGRFGLVMALAMGSNYHRE